MKKTFSLKIEQFKPALIKRRVFNLDSLQLQSKWNSRNTALQNDLKKEIIKYLKVRVDTQNIVFGFGSYSILERLAWKLIEKGLMIGEFPQFRYFPMEYIQAGGSYKGFGRKDFSFPFEEIREAIKTRKNLKIVYINNPNNPTGQFWDIRQVTEIIRLAEKKRVLVLIDEIYGDLALSEKSYARLVNEYKNLIVVRSFSKILGLQNLRVGYMIASSDIIEKYKNICNWDEINNIGAKQALRILKNIPAQSALQKKMVQTKKIMTALLLKKEYSVVPSSFEVPILFVKKKGIPDLGEYFRKKNIKVEGSAVFQVLDKKFPKCYTRIRVPLSTNFINEIKAKL